MKPLTEIEKDFNAIAKSYGLKAFTAQDFKHNKELTKALDSYKTSQKTPLKLQDDLSNIHSIEIGYINFFEYYDKELHDNREDRELSCTASLFELIQPIEEIACNEYFETYIYGFIIQDDGENITIDQKVKDWHTFRRLADKIPSYINTTFPRWEHVGKIEKKVYAKEHEKRIEQLNALGNDTHEVKIVQHFLEKGFSLNQLANFKAGHLLSLRLPGINTPQIAKKIIKFSKL